MGEQVERVTIDDAIESAARILRAAEMETNHTTMERLEKIADSWMSLAALLITRERE